MKTLKTIPTFTSQEEENTFWKKHDSSEFIDWNEAKKIRFPKLQMPKPSLSVCLSI